MITCPSCHTSAEAAARVGPIAICAGCGATLVVDATGIRRAIGADITALSDADLQQLRIARGRIARPGRRQP